MSFNPRMLFRKKQLSELSEEEILQKAAAKDPICQKWIYDRYSGKMMSVCYRYSADRMEAEDILQDGFIRVFDYLHQYKFQGSFEGWVRRVIVTTALNHIKKKSSIPVESDIDLANDAAAGSFDPFQSQYTMEELMNLVRSLPPGYRTVFNLYVIDGYNHQEISEMLGITTGGSKSNLARARAALQKKLIQQEHQVRNYGGTRQNG